MRLAQKLVAAMAALSLSFLTGSAEAAGRADLFSRGIAAFQAGDYKTALTEFLLARKAGTDSPNLRYDLAATYFKLGRYQEAAREYVYLASLPGLAALAHYNLGLIALKQGQMKVASSEFSRVVRLGKPRKIAILASDQLSRLNRASAGQIPQWVGFVDMGGGYNSDVSLLSHSALITAAGKGSGFTRFFVGGIGQLTGTPESGLRLAGTLYQLHYFSLSTYDQTLLRVGLTYQHPVSDWNATISAYANQSDLHGKMFETFDSLRFQIWRSFARSWEAHFRYRYTHITGASTYAYLSGRQQQIGLEVRHRVGGARLRLGYSLELNRRADLAVGGQFYSASPTRNEIYLRTEWPVRPHTSVFLRVSYQSSHYNAPDVFLLGGSLVARTRVDNRYRGGVGARFRLAGNWSIVGEYQYDHAHSSYSLYTYGSNLYSLQLEHYF